MSIATPLLIVLLLWGIAVLIISWRRQAARYEAARFTRVAALEQELEAARANAQAFYADRLREQARFHHGHGRHPDSGANLVEARDLVGRRNLPLRRQIDN